MAKYVKKYILQDSCGNDINLEDRVRFYDEDVEQQVEGKVVDWFGESLVILPDYALMALAPYYYLVWIKANTVTKIT